MKRVEIVGLHKSVEETLETRPAEGVSRWGLNVPTQFLRDKTDTFTAWFELHQRYRVREKWPRGHLEWLQGLFIPVYVWNPSDFPDLKLATRYPKDQVEALTNQGRYHAGSFDWMVALAVLLDYDVIELHGVDLSHTGTNGEPISARACLEYWCGVAEGRNTTVHSFAEDLFYTYHLVRSTTQYGFEAFQLVEDK